MASLLSDGRDSSGRRAFLDVDVLPSASVPIVAMSHAATRIEIDLSCSTGAHDTDVPHLIDEAVARHAAMRPLALVLKVLLMQRGLHQTYHGGIGSFKLYVLLAAWLGERAASASSRRRDDASIERDQRRCNDETRGNDETRDDLGACLLGFLHSHATGLGRVPVVCHGVEADFSRVRVHECMAAFAEAARALAQHRRLAAVIDARTLQRMRERSVSRAEAFTGALLAERAEGGCAAAGAVADGSAHNIAGQGEGVASLAPDPAHAHGHAQPQSGPEPPPKRPRRNLRGNLAMGMPTVADRRVDTTRGSSIFDLVQ